MTKTSDAGLRDCDAETAIRRTKDQEVGCFGIDIALLKNCVTLRWRYATRQARSGEMGPFSFPHGKSNSPRQYYAAGIPRGESFPYYLAERVR